MKSTGASSEADDPDTRDLDVLKHLGLIVSLIAFAIVGLRVVAVAHGDMQTVAAILQLHGWVSVPGIVLTSLPIALMIAWWASVQDLGERIRESQPLGRSTALAICLGIPALLLGPRNWVPLIAIAAILFCLTGIAMRRFIREKEPDGAWVGPVLVVALGLGCVALSSKPWLPLEQVTMDTTGDERVMSAYVIGTSGGRTALMDDDTRTIAWIDDEDIRERTLCSQPLGERPLLASFIWREPPDNACE